MEDMSIMVQDVNKEAVEPEDKLSDKVQFYDSKEWSSKMPRSVKAGLQWKRQGQKKRVFIKNFKRIGRKI